MHTTSDFLAGGGETGALMRALDWSATPLGEPEGWPPALKTLVQVALGSVQPTFVVWGPERTALYNDACAAICGDRHPRALGRPVRELWSDIWDKVEPAMARGFAGEAVRVDDIGFATRRRGRPEETHLAFSCTPVLDDEGRVAGVFCPCTDTTRRVLADRRAAAELGDQRRVLEALQQSEANYRHAVELSPQTAWTSAPDGQLDHVGPRWREWTGKGGLGSEWGEAVHPEDLGRSVDAWTRSVATGEVYDVEHRVRMRDGAYRWMHSRAFPRRDEDGRIVRWYGTTEDVDDQKAAQAAFQASDARFQAIVNSVDQMIWSTLPDGYHDYYNQRWYDYTGMRPGSTDGDGWNGIFHPDDQERAWAVWRRSLETGEPYYIEYRLRHRSGFHRWVLGRAQPVRDEHGRITRWFGTCTDIEEIVQAREVLARSRAELEQLVEARTHDLLQAEEQLRQSQKLEAIGQLTGGVAHDFNNLLTVIRGSVDLLRRPDLPEERRRRYVEAISETTTRATKLTGQLLAFARRQALKPEVFDVGASVAGVREMMSTLTGSRIGVSVDAPTGRFWVNADPSQFDTALVNMAVNARDAMNGEGRLTLAVRAVSGMPAVRSHPAADGDYVAVFLSDTGAGIPADRLEQIFEPFFTTKEVGQGTGLGLSQVYGFAKQSGGEVAVESEPGHGAVFTLYLPLVAAPADAGRTEDAAEPPAESRGACVLVVEDNADVGAFAVQSLAEFGHRTVLARTAAEALERLAEGSEGFDVVFSDVVMPGMNGVELGREIRRLYADLPVVLTSGYSQVLAQNGAHGFELLHKPYSMDELSRVLRKAAAWRGRAGQAGAEASR